MAGRADRAPQFKITLKDTKPPVWRRIQVPGDATFWDFHVAIQDAMGWLDCHLHQFEVHNPRKRRTECIGIPDKEFPSEVETLAGWKVPVSRLLSSSNPKATYLYDFGDGWEHAIELEKTLKREPGIAYPRCLAGRRKCPPEDCGGTWGYQEFLEAISDPNHPEHKAMLDWFGDEYDPDGFDCRDVVFSDPRERLADLLEEDNFLGL